MATESTFYLQQVAKCAREAAESLLPNQRAMHLRSQAAWQALADRKLLTETNRAKSEAQKAFASGGLLSERC